MRSGAQQQQGLLVIYVLLGAMMLASTMALSLIGTVARRSHIALTSALFLPPCSSSIFYHPTRHGHQPSQGIRTRSTSSSGSSSSRSGSSRRHACEKDGSDENKKRPATNQPKQKVEMFRLDRLLANRGVGSRTEVTVLVRRGKVALQNGEVIKDPKFHLPSTALLFVNQEPIRPLPLLVAYNKPLGVHSTMGDPMGRPNLEDTLHPRLAKLFHPVGRLDADTTGLLLFSIDGQLTQRLLHPSGNVQREYLATVELGDEGEGGKDKFDEAKLRETLKQGVETADGTYPAELLGVSEAIKKEIVEKEEEDGEEGGEKTKGLLVLRVGVSEGKHRMVRRLLANAGYPVVGLHRVRYGRVELGDLAEGEIVEIDDASDVGQWARRMMEGKH
ncbi:hypothetical protein VYU27_000427 [Nannochloropsis oceanica]